MIKMIVKKNVVTVVQEDIVQKREKKVRKAIQKNKVHEDFLKVNVNRDYKVNLILKICRIYVQMIMELLQQKIQHHHR